MPDRPRKAKPLRMFMVKAPEGTLLYHTMAESKGGSGVLLNANADWSDFHKRGYRIVRVLVTEE
jgi:hypothetical protein